MKKYELLKDDILLIGGRTLYRIRARRSFGGVTAGELGGYIETEENLSHKGAAWVYEHAQVWDTARVFGDAEVHGNVAITGRTRVFGRAQVYGHATLGEDASVYDDAHVYGRAVVYGSASIGGRARVFGEAHVHGRSVVTDDARVYADGHVYGSSYLYGLDESPETKPVVQMSASAEASFSRALAKSPRRVTDPPSLGPWCWCTGGYFCRCCGNSRGNGHHATCIEK